IDSRPTGPAIADAILKVLAGKNINVQYLDITAAPEIMAYSRKIDGFVYISASHNPVGHNGIKFGLNDGGVLPGSETAKLVSAFKELFDQTDIASKAASFTDKCSSQMIEKIYSETENNKKNAVESYKEFTKQVVSGTENPDKQSAFFNAIKENVSKNPLSIVCDMNGSARTLSIDNDFLANLGIKLFTINGKPRQIVHAIIPEPENLVYCAKELNELRKNDSSVTLGYMPDCDGDRGNIVYWNNKTNKAEVLKAQEVFALSVLAELAYNDWLSDGKPQKTAVSVNDPTSMRIDDITEVFDAKVFRAEVGEANVVNLARELREKGYAVPILGEGSNGGNITHPAAVRDPLNTIFALIKLLVLRDSNINGKTKLGLFHTWCIKSAQENLYKENFSLEDIIETLPYYTTTGVSENRALLQIQTKDHGLLKARFQQALENQWEEKKQSLKEKYGIDSYVAICNNGTKETTGISDFSISGRGGLKILFKDENKKNAAYIWMRGSGTEPVFRILCDVKGNNPQMEAELLEWETSMLKSVDL
ncbi:MAG: phosphoglucomutase, partial [Spirochaetaceae bacterium]|nr:phosphoglucomutase [Spirochaetaceae bacterium]